MVKGMLSLLQSCPKEVAHLRKELLIAARHILATDLRNSKFTNVNGNCVISIVNCCMSKYTICGNANLN